jgi:hypothetical protein
MIADTELRDIRANFRHYSGDLVAEHGRCREYRVRSEEQVGVTEARRLHIDKNFAPDRLCDPHFLEVEWTADGINDKRLHANPPFIRTWPIVPKQPGWQPEAGALAVSRLAAFPESVWPLASSCGFSSS